MDISVGSVNSIAASEEKIFIAGDFTALGPYTGTGTVVDTSSGKRDGGWPIINGQVNVAISDGKGGWFVGGRFTRVSGIRRGNLTHLRSDKTVDPDFYYEYAGAEVNALLRLGDVLYVAGYSATQDPLIAVNLLTNKRVSSFVPKISGTSGFHVRRVAANDSIIFVVGEFEQVNGAVRKNFAALRTSDGQLYDFRLDSLAWRPHLALWDSVLIVNQRIKGKGGIIKNHVVCRKIQTEEVLWELPYEGYESAVSAFQVVDSVLYVAGSFEKLGDSTRHNIGAIDVKKGDVQSWNPDIAAAVSAFCVNSRAVFLSYGQSLTRAFDRTTGKRLLWDASPGDFGVFTIAHENGRIFIGGDLGTLNIVQRDGLGCIDEKTGRATGWNPKVKGKINKLLLRDSLLYLAGRFQFIDGQRRVNLAAINIQTNGVTPFFVEVDTLSEIFGLEADDSLVYFEGNFTKVNGENRSFLASAYRESGKLTNWNPNPNRLIGVLKKVGPVLYVGGVFDSIGGQSRTLIASFIDGSLTEWSPRLKASGLGGVYAMVPYRGDLFVGGRFDSVNGKSRRNLAAFRLGTSELNEWNPAAEQGVDALDTSEAVIYVAPPTTVGGTYQNFLFAVDANFGYVLAWNPSPVLPIRTIASSTRFMYVGGPFFQIGVPPDDSRQIRGIAGISKANVSTVHRIGEVTLPSSYLLQNFPNPFNSSTTITFGVSQTAKVSLTIFDVLGREITTLVDATLVKGEYRKKWDSGPASGIYFYQLKTGQEKLTGRLVILR